VADSAISTLTLADLITDADLFVLEQNGEAKKLKGATLTEYVNRNVVSVSIHALSPSATPTADYDRITGNLSLGVPRGNSIVTASIDSNSDLILIWADGTTVNCGNVKGDTGKSAYDYAVENGYTGEETDFATLQVNLYNASLNENERIIAEANRQSNYTYMMGRVDQKLAEMESVLDNTATAVVGTTLVLNTVGTGVVGTTLML